MLAIALLAVLAVPQGKLGGSGKVGGTVEMAVQVTAGAPFVNDTFTEATTVLLAAHTGETGATWTEHPAAIYNDVMSVTAATDRIFPTGSPTAFYASGIPPSADYSVCADVFAHTNEVANIGPCGRMDTTADTMYCARYDSGTVWQLRRGIAGTLATIGSSTNQLVTLGTSKRLCLVMVGTTISMTVEGTQEASVVDANITAAGRAGLRSSGGATATTGFHLDNFTAQ